MEAILNLCSHSLLCITLLCRAPGCPPPGQGLSRVHPDVLVPGMASGTEPTYHQGADLDLLILGGLVDLFEQ